jgi:hypothetical protein
MTRTSSLVDPRFPVVPKPLLERLEELFPSECPRLDMGDREIWFRCGQRAVVELLLAEYEQQKKEAL